MRTHRVQATSLVIAGAFALLAVTALRAQPPDQRQSSIPSSRARLVVMQHHFTEVGRIHEAVIRGDLAAVRAPADTLARITTPPEVPPESRNFVAAIRARARLAATATTLAGVATETVAMLRECAACHEALNVRPAPASREMPDVGGVVGHMLEHQRASDELLEGLVIPSPAHWSMGAERLRAAPLHRGELPMEGRLAQRLIAFDETVHELADQAAAADTWPRRTDAYARLLTTCAACHSLHREIWGPDSRPR
jgi:cytochrome c553